MKTVLHLLFTALFILLMYWPFIGMPRLGSYLNYSSGFMQIKSPELTDPQIRFINHKSIEASIYIDSIGVPHIFANNDSSTAFALGYMHARDRLFQMELMMRMVQGRLSELFGQRALKSDIFWRSFRFKQLAENSMQRFRESYPEYYGIFRSYADGVNHYLRSLSAGSLPEEFHLLDFKPDKWQVYNIVLLNKYMSYLLTYNEKDIFIQEVIDNLPEEMIKIFYPMQEKQLNSVIPEQKGSINPNNRKISSEQNKFNTIGFDKTDQERIDIQTEIGSNNWAVSGKKSKSGKALLSNDMHLGLNLPAPWYEVHMKTPTKHTYGLSIPGSSVSIVGTNGEISWGLTNANWDLVDFYQIKYASSDSLTYYYGNEIDTLQIYNETIQVKGQSDYPLRIKKSKLGPILNIKNRQLAVEWIAAKPTNEGLTLLKLERANNWNQFKQALSHWSSPPQNFIYADTAGNIGIYSAGSMPLKSEGKERGIFTSTDTVAIFKGYIPFQELPHIYNPEKGFIQSANQRQIFNANHYYNWATMAPPFRGYQIHDRLETNDSIDIYEIRDIQADIVDRSAERILPVLINAVNLDSRFSNYINLLKKWDFKMIKEDPEPLIYQEYLDLLLDRIAGLIKNGNRLINPNKWTLISYYEDHDTIDINGFKKSRDLFTQEIFLEVIERLVERFGSNPGSWRYGDYHKTKFQHVLKLPAFSPDIFPSDGSQYTVRVARGPTVTHGSSQRHMFHMTYPVQVFVNIAGGQSGRPSSKNYTNQLEDWKSVSHRKAQYVNSPDQLTGIEFRIHIGGKE